MDEATLKLAEGLVSPAYVRQGSQALAQRKNQVKALLSQRRLPATGWDDTSIEIFLQDLSAMDSNNFMANAGLGEREARCASALVHRRHYGMTHGIGRSGNITDEQPKAAGSTLVSRVTNFLVRDALKIAGMKDVGPVTVLPVATGMALTLCLLALKRTARPASAQYVVWPRIDQKTCLKCVQAAGLTLVVVENAMDGDELRTDVGAIERELVRLGAENVVCVLSTTSCFAARAPDRVEDVAKLCHKLGVGHVINNAYGVQSSRTCASIASAWRKGRLDAVIQSTDKNFLVPVGGSVVAAGPGGGPSNLVDAVNGGYPGRASISPILDVLITLLSLGQSGWQRLLRQREEELFPNLRSQLAELAASHGERLLHTPHNPISLAISLSATASALASSAVPLDCCTSAAEATTLGAKAAVKAAAAVPDAATSQAALEAEASTTAPEAAAAAAPPKAEPPTAATTKAATAELAAVDPTAAADIGASHQGPHAADVSRRGCSGASIHGTAVDRPMKSGTNTGGNSSRDSKGRSREEEAAAASPAPATAPAAPAAAAAAALTDTTRNISPGATIAVNCRPPPLTFLGSMLFSRRVSGCRVIPQGQVATVAGVRLVGFGASHSNYPVPYLTAAAALGGSKEEVDQFIATLDKCLRELKNRK